MKAQRAVDRQHPVFRIWKHAYRSFRPQLLSRAPEHILAAPAIAAPPASAPYFRAGGAFCLYAGNFGRKARRERSSPALVFAAETNSAAPIPYAACSLFLTWNRFLINKNGRSTAKCRIDARAIATASCAANTNAKLCTSMPPEIRGHKISRA
jgi:hypothetical protein